MNSVDPRGKSSHYLQKTSLRFKNKKFEFVPTQFIIDEHYVGEPPRVQVGFTNLNDNIDENFLRKEISKVGPIRTLEIVRHPQTRRHLGLAKVQFEDPQLAARCVESYNDHNLMGKKLSVFLDVRFTEIEGKKLKLLNPEPKIRNNPTQPKLPESLPSMHSLTQLSFPAISIPPPPNQDIVRSNMRASHAPLSLDDRLAKLGLKQIGVYSPTPPKIYPIQEHNTPLQQYNQNSILKRTEIKTEIPNLSVEEDEKAWNPTYRNPEPEPKLEPESESKEEILLTDEQIVNEVLPYCYEKFIRELQRNLLTTLQRRLIQTFGYPCINKAQERHKEESDRKQLEKLREELEKKKKQQENLALLQANNRVKERKYVGREVAGVTDRKRAEPVRIRRDNGDSGHVQGRHFASGMHRRINRSAAFDESQEQDSRQRSSGSLSDISSRHSRSPNRSPSSSSESSGTSSPDSSTSSSSYNSSLSSVSSRSSFSPVPSFRSEKASPKFKIETFEFAGTLKPTEDSEKAAAEALLEFSSQNHEVDKVLTPKVELATKKRKKKALGEEKITIKKAKTDDGDDQHEPKPIPYPPRSKDDISKLYSSLDFDLEDMKYLELCHSKYEAEHRSDERAGVPFGSQQATEIHIIIKENDIDAEVANKCHPRWWKGCSRCNHIKISDKGKIEETVDYDLQKAAIKSHVIQAANSTRRDQRNDQRRIATLNPDIDLAYLKQNIPNSLQMRAKNLRFSRSKIHKWGLFACEKIATGDAVIEYVGEKIRPSVADHREKNVYTNLPTHDGSSYFFRVDSDVIDATLKGNKARFINHSCSPNCIAKVIKHENGTNSIVIYAKQAIEEDEEITYDYKFPREENKIECRCRSIHCQKYLN